MLAFYLSWDGESFKPTILSQAEIQAEIKTSAETVSVELFVMSHCPYGVQMEKGILPVLKLLDTRIDFSLKFVDYAMHGKTELDEQTRQYFLWCNLHPLLIGW